MTAREVAAQASRLAIEMPITEAVCAVLNGDITAREAVAHLMERDTKTE
jgi:glycerol-3-phosphate dehydrogenase